SRRRHTRWPRDWSSDVCSSDLVEALAALERAVALNPDHANAHYLMAFVLGDLGRHQDARAASKRAIQLNPPLARAQTNLSLERRSEERRVGKEFRSRGAAGRVT